MRVTANDGTTNSPAVTSSPVTVVNSAPTATVSLSSSSPTTNQTLTATATRSDADGDTVTLTYLWTVNGSPVRTTVTTALTDALDLSVAGNGDPGQTIVVTVTPNDGTANGTGVSATATVSAGAAPPIFADDFSSGGFTNWNSFLRLTIDTGTGSPAAPSARAQVTAQSASATKDLAQTYTQICASLNVSLSNNTSNAVDLFRLRSANNGALIKVFVAANGQLFIRSDASGTQTNSGVALGTGFHNVELCGTVGTSASWTLYRDGNPILTVPTANTGTAPIVRLQIGDTAAKTFTMNIDQVRLDLVPGDAGGPPADTTPPTQPGQPTGSSPSAGTIQISWTASTDASPPITYRIYRDGNPTSIGQTTSLTFTDPGLTPGTSHTYRVDAVDAIPNAPEHDERGLGLDPGLGSPGGHHPADPAGAAHGLEPVRRDDPDLVDGVHGRVPADHLPDLPRREPDRDRADDLAHVRRSVAHAGDQPYVHGGRGRRGPEPAESDEPGLGLDPGLGSPGGHHPADPAGAAHGIEPVRRDDPDLLDGVHGRVPTDHLPDLPRREPDLDRTDDLAHVHGPGLTPGTSHTYTVDAVDAVPNPPSQMSQASASILVSGPPADTTPPTQPGQPTGSSPSAGMIQISWTASTDASPPITYRIYRDGNPTSIGQTTSLTFMDPGLTPGTSHTYTVDAVDAVPNAPSQMSQASASILVSGGAPPAIFSDDFSSGDLSNWTSFTRITIDNTTGSPAAPSGRAAVTNLSAFAYRDLASPVNQACFSLNVSLSNNTSNAVDLFRLRGTGNTAMIRVYAAANGILFIRSDFSGVQASSNTALGTGFHNVELCGTVGTNTTWTLYRDGNPIGTFTGSTGTVPLARVQIGDNAAKTFTANFDQVRLDQVQG